MTFPTSPFRAIGLHGPLLALLCGGAVLGLAFGPGPEEEPLRTRIEAIDANMPGAASVGDASILAVSAVGRFYRQNAFEPAWTDATGPTRHADSLLAVLRNADRDGLRPADYHVAAIDSLRQHLRAQAESGEPRARGLVDFELLCTDAFLLFGSHLLTGRVDPTTVTPTWTAEGRRADLVQTLQRALAEASPRAALDELRPPQPEYEALRRALARYRTLAERGGWPSLPDGPTLKMDMHDDRVSLLRTRLRTTGDLSAAAPTDSARVDTALHEAVQRFQERHGLTVDGAVGPATRAALNVPVEERIEQITLNLERWRWLPADLGRLHVRVNIAGFDLRVVEEGTDRLQMRVVAGRAYRQTPVFSDQISYLVLNPYWHVPHSIAAKDKLPDFRRDPSLVSKLGYEVFRGWGADATPIDPSTIDWNAVSASSFPYRLRQRPGPQNALGQVKFMFPNAHSIYLHDTPSRALFGEAERNFSSGCIRVEHPLDLAAVLLRHNEGWTRERIESTVGSNTEKTVVLPQKVPVHLLYWTAWATADGPVHFRRDVYDRDEAVHSALAAPLDREAANEDIGGSSSTGF